MKLFWKINLYINLIVFVLFLLYIISIKSHIINASITNLIATTTFLFFIYGAFLEIIQMPICIIAAFFKNKPKRVWLFF
ncbi:hypothetical protein AR687_17185 [Flavobacteriaceae bacterium CRH]|nr:hypothetical protein AR687_17185 [Flavobacteriaceae bacterium CRH]